MTFRDPLRTARSRIYSGTFQQTSIKPPAPGTNASRQLGNRGGNVIVHAPSYIGHAVIVIPLDGVQRPWTPLFPSYMDSINTNLDRINNSLLAYDFVSLGRLLTKRKVFKLKAQSYNFRGPISEIILLKPPHKATLVMQAHIWLVSIATSENATACRN